MKYKLGLILLCLTFILPSAVFAAEAITISTVTPAVNQSVTVTFQIPDDNVNTHTMLLTTADGSTNITQDTSEPAGSYAYINVTFKEEKTVKLIASLVAGSTTVLTNNFNVSVKGNNSPNTTVDIKQTGSQNGFPVVQASVKDGLDTGTYSVVLSNPDTNTTFSKTLINDGTVVSFTPTNYSVESNYNYVLRLNGNDVSSGYIPLKLVRVAPMISAKLNGSNLTLTVNNAADYIGNQIQFESGSYKNSMTISGANDIKAFTNVTGTTDTINFYDTDLLITSALLEVVNSSKPTVDVGVVGNDSTTAIREDHGIIMKLDKTTYDENDVITATVSVSETSQYNRSVTLRVAADSSSVIKVMNLDSEGKGEAVIKVNVPLNSSKYVYATLYAISGDTLNSTSVQYNLKGQTNGGTKGATTSGSTTSSGTKYDSQATKAPIPKETGKTDYAKTDGQFSDNIPSVEYVAVDLTNLQSKKATIAWYRANHVQLYTTKLIVTNNTTHDQHSYKLWMPNGDGKINLDLIYDGSGIYTWTLLTGGKIVAQAPYSTALGIDKAGVLSQDGLPVVIPAVNIPFDEPQTIGSRPGEVNGSNLGTAVGAVTDNTDTEQVNQDQALAEPAKKSQTMKLVILGFIMVALVGAGVYVFLMLRRQKASEEIEGAA